MAVLATAAGATVSAQYDADFYASVYGTETVILPIGDRLELTFSSATQVDVANGTLLCQGRQIIVPDGESFTIPSGTATTYYIGYTITVSGGSESMTQFVQTTQPTNGAALRDGATTAYAVLGKVVTSATTITSVELIPSVGDSLGESSTSSVTEYDSGRIGFMTSVNSSNTIRLHLHKIGHMVMGELHIKAAVSNGANNGNYSGTISEVSIPSGFLPAHLNRVDTGSITNGGIPTNYMTVLTINTDGTLHWATRYPSYTERYFSFGYYTED